MEVALDKFRSILYRIDEEFVTEVINDVADVIKTFILNTTTCQFPPQDEFNYSGKEEICATLAVMIVSYIILAMPCFVGRSNKQRQRQQARLWKSRSKVSWSLTFKQLLYIRSFDDLHVWWDELRTQRRSLQKRGVHSKSWDEFMKSEASRLQLNDANEGQRTVRARGDGGVDVPHTPLQKMFNGKGKSHMHASASDGKFNTAADGSSSAKPPPDLIERFYSHAQKNGITASAMVDSFYEDSVFGPETDHDRFVSAWESHIRFSQYRRLVLPPTCKLYRPSSVSSHTLFDRREFLERNLHLLVDESTWRKILSYLRNLYDILDKILSKLLNKKSTEKFSEHMMNVFRYRIRKRRGLPVEEDEDEDTDDDGSVATAGSSSTAGKKTPLRGSAAQSEMTPVVTNRKEVVVNVPPLASVPLQTNSIPPSLVPPSLIGEEDIGEVEDSKPPQDKGHVTFTFIDEKRDEPPIESVRDLVPLPAGANDDTRDEGSSNSEREQVQEILNDVIKEIDDVIKEIEDVEIQVDSSSLNVSMMSVDCHDGTSPLRPRFHTAEANDEISFVTSTEQNQEMPVTPKKHASPLQVKSLAKVKEEDANVPLIPMLKPIAVADSQSDRVSPMPSPNIKRNNSFDNATNMMFFDTADSNRQLANMSRDAPIPDSGGYILGDEFLGSSCTPLLVFINSRSGSQQGDLLITQFRRLLNPIQIWDLANGGPEKVLKSFSVLSRFQVLICGGDGTVSWIISALEKMELKRWPPIGILPLGTGNDLARVHGWGGGYNNQSLLYILKQISEAYVSMLDLWELDITTVNKKGKTQKEAKAFLNYLGVGVDAQAALQVHNLRESKPKLFVSRFLNKAYYALAGGEEAIKNSCTDLSEQITLVADGIEIPLPPDSQGIIFLNIDSYSGGE